MSVHIRNLAIDAFRASAEMAFQSGSRLRDHVTVVEGVQAETYRFPVFGTGDAYTRASQQAVVPANTGNAKPRAVLRPREWFDLLDKQDAALTNVDAARPYGSIGGKAVARQMDEDIIEVLKSYDAAAYSRAGLAAGLTMTTDKVDKLEADDMAKAVAMLMDEMDGVDGNLALVAPALQFSTWTADTKLANFEYLQQGAGTGNVTATAKFSTIYGFTPILIGQAARRDGHGRLPDKRAYLWDKRCVGLAIGTTTDMGVMEWVPMHRSVLIGAEANAGATRINNSGIVEIVIK